MKAFQGVDYYDVDSLLSDEEKQIRQTVRDFVSERVMPEIAEYYERGEFPRELIPQLARLGFLGPTFPEEYGGIGLGAVAYGLIMQELERGDSGLRSFASVQASLVMFPIFTFGSEEQKRRWLPRLASGEAIGCFGLTEPDHGSDPGGMTTWAKRKGDRYVLNGAKMWITNGTVSDVAVVWAKEEGVVRGFLVEKGTPGFTSKDQTGKYSLRASVTSELVLADVEIPEANVLPKTDGLKCALRCLDNARYGIAWGAVGAAMACYDMALGYSKERIQFGKPIAKFQLVQIKLVEMLTEITKAQLLAVQLGRLRERGAARHVHVSLAKRNNVAMALDCARTARDVLGANGITSEYHVMRHMMNLESVYTYEGTHDIHGLIVGSDITGEDAVT
jgi:alkylation response protein AidB-like acyl-CoA dehydrogenase